MRGSTMRESVTDVRIILECLQEDDSRSIPI